MTAILAPTHRRPGDARPPSASPGCPPQPDKGPVPAPASFGGDSHGTLGSFNPGHQVQPSFLRTSPETPRPGHAEPRADPCIHACARPRCCAWGWGGAPAATRLCRGARVAGAEQKGCPPVPGSCTPPKRSLGLRERSHRDPPHHPVGAAAGPGSAAWAAPGVSVGCAGGLRGLLGGSPWAAPGVPMPPAPQAGSAPEPLLGTEQGEHRFGTSPCPPAPSPSRYE